MRFVIYCPGLPFHGATIAEGKSLGGSESAAYYLARALAGQGHQVTVFTAIPREQEGRWEGVRYLAAGQPSPQAPLGAEFEWYAAGTPYDVLILQRVPDGFARPLASKVNLWWSHDLALKRYLPRLHRQLWALDRVLAVSAFHKAQIAGVYGIPAGRIEVVPNGVDPALFAAVPAPGSEDDRAEAARKWDGGRLVYSSRPERGLARLVAPGGLMERLAASAPGLRLQVAGYENTTPALRPFYEYLWRRCAELPNVELLGALSKKELADVMRGAWLHVYPTDFEEVSCITAMEAQAAGTPVLATRLAALPETLAGGGAILLDAPVEAVGEPPPDALGEPQRADGAPTAPGTPAVSPPVPAPPVPALPGLIGRFERELLALRADHARWEALRAKALAKRAAYDWEASAARVAALAEGILRERSASGERLARHLIRHSDIVAARQLAARLREQNAALPAVVQKELDEPYGFLAQGRFAEHYEAFARWQNAQGLDQGHADPARLLAIPRFRAVEELVSRLPEGARVLDYACGQGHFTCALAAKYPRLSFHGVDLAPAAVEVGQARLRERPLPNVTLAAGEAGSLEGRYDMILACEVLEHVPAPGVLVEALAAKLAPEGLFCLTVPYGPWEAESYATVPFRSHIHHFERQDLEELWGHLPGYRVVAIPIRATAEGEPLGIYRVTFGAAADARAVRSGTVDLARKLTQQAPRETCSVCIVCRADTPTLARTLESVRGVADQLVLAIDGERERERERSGDAWSLAGRWGAEAFAIRSPLETGFDAARNATVARARCDWVLWIDDDEALLWPERLPKYLRPNGYDAYAVRQHHFAAEPAGLIKTDLPCRLFRNFRGFRFYGVVHEHPELALNTGAGQVMLLPDLAICHNGYETEEIRRARFRRNLPLMLRDRQQYPARVLGKFLWIRDLAHLNRYALESGEGIGPAAQGRARQAVDLWRDLLRAGHLRMALDALPYYSEAVQTLAGEGIAFELAMGASRAGLGDAPGSGGQALRGQFLDTADIRLLTERLMREKTALFDERYF